MGEVKSANILVLMAVLLDCFLKIRSLKPVLIKLLLKLRTGLKKNKQDTFFPEVPVIFKVDGSVSHYHIPTTFKSLMDIRTY